LLRVSDIDRERMLLRVAHAMLSPVLLEFFTRLVAHRATKVTKVRRQLNRAFAAAATTSRRMDSTA
jgi:hypothetical protein